MSKDYLSFSDLSVSETTNVLLLARKLKKNKTNKFLAGKTVGLVFQKPSTRTTVSFAVGVVQLGGHPLILSADVLQLKRGETPKDTGRVLSRYLDAIVMRADHHEDMVEMARYATIPVINGLTDKEHPCQVLADLLTIMDRLKMKHPKDLKGFKITYIGDGNNVAQSLVLASAMFGMELKLSCPKGYEPKQDFLDRAHVQIVEDPAVAVRGVNAIYTDVWTSMGQESESQKRRAVFASYQLNRALLEKAAPKALVMHCLPAHRGEEITEDVLEGPQSVVFDQAENRLHVQKAVLATILK